jgi:hypothetical protein
VVAFAISVLLRVQDGLSRHLPKGPERRSDSRFGFPEPVLATVEFGNERAVLNADNWFEVQAPHDRSEIQVMCLAKLSRSQPVVAVVSGPVVAAQSGTAEESGDFCPRPCGPVWAASIQRVDPQTKHGWVRIQARYLGFRTGFTSPGPRRPTSVRNGASKRSAGGCRVLTGDSEDGRHPA